VDASVGVGSLKKDAIPGLTKVYSTLNIVDSSRKYRGQVLYEAQELQYIAFDKLTTSHSRVRKASLLWWQ